MRPFALAMATALVALPQFAAPARADRLPTADERAQLTKVLREHGFVKWGYIERDDGVWEVDNAVTRSGKVYDVDISGGRVVDWDRD